MKTSSFSSNSSTLRTLVLAVGTGLLSLSLVGCGGSSNSTSQLTPVKDDSATNDGGSTSGGSSSGGSSNAGGSSSATANAFTKSATWTVDATKKGNTCYDFDAQTETECTGNKWDLKFDNQARSIKLWSNSGTSGTGKGAVFYLMPLTELQTVKNAKQLPSVGFRPDSGAGVFETNPWAEYNLFGQHKMAPNNQVYLITTDKADASTQSTPNRPVYALQIINYYNEAGKSGYPTIRWIDTALPSKVQTKTVNASDTDKWVYVNLKTGEIVSKDGDWQIGLKRYNVVLNSGISGDGTVGGYIAKAPDSYYDEKGKPINEKFKQDNDKEALEALTNVAGYNISKDGVPWKIDIPSSQLNPQPEMKGSIYDFGWYTYNKDKHTTSAKPKDKAIGTIIRSGEGNSYARMQVAEASLTEWKIKFDVQPAE